jgi:hypothetical protein
MYRKILIPFRFKAAARPPLLPTIKALIHDETAEITLLRLVTPAKDYRPQVNEQLYTELRGLYASLQTDTITLRFDALCDADSTCIRDYAERHGIDFIVMHNRSKLEAAQLGQVWRTLPGFTIVRCQPHAALIPHPPAQIAIAAS